jgi:2-dehydropantoate 2-reductase
MKQNGAHIVGKTEFVQPVTALLPSEMTGKYDLVFLMTKQSENPSIVSFLQGFLSENGVICTMQNGLPEPKIAEKIGKDNTYGCAVVWGATFIGAGKSELTSSPDALTFSLGCFGRADERLEKIKDYLSCMGEVKTENNLIGVRWSKLTINAAFSGLSTLTGLTFGEVARHKLGKRMALAVINECCAVADKAGIKPEKIQGHNATKLLRYQNPVKKQISLLLLPIAMKKHSALVSGMLQALKRGQKCEIDYIDGVVSEYGRKYNVKTPVCDAICAMTHEIEEKKRQITIENLAELNAAIKNQRGE